MIDYSETAENNIQLTILLIFSFYSCWTQLIADELTWIEVLMNHFYDENFERKEFNHKYLF